MGASSVFSYLGLLLLIAPFVFNKLSKKVFIWSGLACIAVGVLLGPHICSDYPGDKKFCEKLFGRPAGKDMVQ